MQRQKMNDDRNVCRLRRHGWVARWTFALAAVLMGAMSAAGDEFVWDGTANIWNTAHWSPSGGGAKSDVPYTTAGHVARLSAGTANTTDGEFKSSLRMIAIELQTGALGSIPNGANSTAQALRLSGGKIQYFASGSGSRAGGLHVASDSVLDAPGSGFWTLSAAVSGSGRLLKTGDYSLLVSGNNTSYAGEWRAGSGTSAALEFRALGAIGTGLLSMSNNATLRLGVQSDWSMVNDLAGSGFPEVGQTGSGVTASGIDPATGWQRVSTLRSADGCGIYMEATSASDTEVCKTLFSNTVVYASSGYGIYLAGDAGAANFDPVQATLRHCTIADNGGDGLRIAGRGSSRWAAVSDTVFAGNSGRAVNLGSADYPVFSCTEDYNQRQSSL